MEKQDLLHEAVIETIEEINNMIWDLIRLMCSDRERYCESLEITPELRKCMRELGETL